MLLQINQVYKDYNTTGGREEVLKGVEIKVAPGEIVALAGASGAGKTTLLHIVAGLLAADGGTGTFAGETLDLCRGGAGRRQMGLVFQDPYMALSPHLTVYDIVAEPLRLQGVKRSARPPAVSRALEQAALTPSQIYLHRYPHQLSGGQRQRVALARALVTCPALLLADEPTSMLDVSVGVEILNLLRSLAGQGTAVLLTTHDLAAACYVAHRLVILDGGRVVEQGPPARLIASPQHQVTRVLLNTAGGGTIARAI